MKFIKWLFNFAARNRKKIQKYEESGIAGKIFYGAFAFILLGLSVGIEIWALNSSAFLGIVLFVWSIVMMVASVNNAVVICVAAFKSYAFKGIENAAIDITTKAYSKLDAEKAEEFKEEVDNRMMYRRTPKWLDMVIGVTLLVSVVATVIAFFALAVNWVKKAAIEQ